MLTLIVERLTEVNLREYSGQPLTGPLGLKSIGLCVNPIGDAPGEARGFIACARASCLRTGRRTSRCFAARAASVGTHSTSPVGCVR